MQIFRNSLLFFPKTIQLNHRRYAAGSGRNVNLSPRFGEFLGFLLHPFRQRFFPGDALFRRILPDILADFHRASTFAKASADREERAAHGAEVGGFGSVLGEGFVVGGAGGDGGERVLGFRIGPIGLMGPILSGLLWSSLPVFQPGLGHVFAEAAFL